MPETRPPANASMSAAIRNWFGPPRAHGEVIEDRTVSFLELFYDLVFVVLIAQISHTLATHVDWVGFRNFAIVFTLIWIAWINGSFYHELHGNEDGRGRSNIFMQMGLLVLLSVYAAHAADDAADGRGFAIVYALLMSWIAWQWFNLRKYDNDEMAALVMRYVGGMAVVIAIVVVSIFVNDPDVRLLLWAAAAGVSVLTAIVQIFVSNETQQDSVAITESMAERFGLLTIIVLGEVVVGVAEGLSEVDRSFTTIATGMLALGIGFGVWWNYFDLVGRRQPLQDSLRRGIWNFAHLPLWLSIAAAGAGMVSLVEHATDGRTPVNTAWLIGGATAGVGFSLALITASIAPHPGRKFAPYTLAGAGVLALILAGLRPSPLLLAFGLLLALSLVWNETFFRHAQNGTSISDH